jgi:molecular chaperone DnaJ
MDKNKNYYQILNVTHSSTEKEIKKSYYKLSFKLHPDKNKDIDTSLFNEITEAYNVLTSPLREEYDMKSKWGKNYNEYYELFDVDFNINYDNEKAKLEKFKKNEINNIQIEVDDSFNGNIEYKRWIKCKSCDGTGKDFSAKIVIRDNNGNVVKTFDSEDGCDFCEGLGKDYLGNSCNFCSGKGKIGLNPCSKCGGEKRILGRQKLRRIKLNGVETRIDSMGHFSKDGKVGYLILMNVKKN